MTAHEAELAAVGGSFQEDGTPNGGPSAKQTFEKEDPSTVGDLHYGLIRA